MRLADLAKWLEIHGVCENEVTCLRLDPLHVTLHVALDVLLRVHPTPRVLCCSTGRFAWAKVDGVNLIGIDPAQAVALAEA